MQNVMAIIMALGIASTAFAASVVTRPTPGTQLTMCGDHKVYIVDADKALASGDFRDGIVWEWDAWSAVAVTGMTQSKLDHISECKVTDDGNILLTSSYGWCILVERTTKKILFYTPSVPNAHSATVLPGGMYAIASSSGDTDGYNSVHLFKSGLPGTKVASYTLDAAHGVYWHPTQQRLFTLGGRTLQVYSYDAATPALTLEYEVTTPLSGTHDLTAVTPQKLCVSGKESYIYDIDQKSFRSQPLFFEHTAIKSVNVNPATGEMWYTDAIDQDGTETWSTRTIRWGSDRTGQYKCAFKVPTQDIYKVRVARWGK